MSKDKVPTTPENKRNIPKVFDKEYGIKPDMVEFLKMIRLTLNGKVPEFYDLKSASRDYVDRMFDISKLGGYLPQVFDITSRDIDFKKRNRHVFVELTDFDAIIDNIASETSKSSVGNINFVFDIPIQMIKSDLEIDPKDFNNLLTNVFRKIPGKLQLGNQVDAEIVIKPNQIRTGISSLSGNYKTTNVVIKLIAKASKS
jgi:hypothetical protein